MAIAAGYAYGYIHNSLIVEANPSATISNLNTAPGLFGGSVKGWFIILITDLLVAWGLYKYFAAGNNKIAVASGAAETITMVKMILTAPMAIAELRLAVWLIWKGGKK